MTDMGKVLKRAIRIATLKDEFAKVRIFATLLQAYDEVEDAENAFFESLANDPDLR